MSVSKLAATLALIATLSACGGESGSMAGGAASVTPTPAPTATPTPGASSACSLRARQDWAFSTLNEFYLFPETLPAALDPTPFTTVDAYIDALTATARSQRRDRNFTYLTSIAQENAFYASGTSAGFGIRLANDTSARRTFVIEAFEGAPALAAGVDRGTEILAIGNDAGSLRSVSTIIASEGSAGVTSALGPSTAGTTRVLQITDAAGTRTITLSKADYSLQPVSPRYGSRIITDGASQVGYLNLRTFISTAEPQLRTAFAEFRAQGITSFIIDFRYDGGGLVSTAEVLGDLLGGNRRTTDVFSKTTFRASKSSNNSIKTFAPNANSVSPVKIAFIGTGATASASELVINAFGPYLGTNVALIGTNTFGKPVGQIAVDRAACDDRLRVVAFSLRNANDSDAYYDGLAATVPVTCRATDDLTRALGDAREASIRSSLDFLAGRSCGGSITSSGQTASAERQTFATAPTLTLLTPDAPDTPQREAPGSF